MSTTDIARLKELTSQREALLKQQENNYRKMGELEKTICERQAEVNYVARDVQCVGLQIAQLKQRIAEARDNLFQERFINKVKETLDKDTYLKLVNEVNGMINA